MIPSQKTPKICHVKDHKKRRYQKSAYLNSKHKKNITFSINCISSLLSLKCFLFESAITKAAIDRINKSGRSTN